MHRRCGRMLRCHDCDELVTRSGRILLRTPCHPKRDSHAHALPVARGSISLREGPLLLAVHGGVTNTHVLTVLEGIGFLFFPGVVWILAIIYTRDLRVRFISLPSRAACASRR